MLRARKYYCNQHECDIKELFIMQVGSVQGAYYQPILLVLITQLPRRPDFFNPKYSLSTLSCRSACTNQPINLHFTAAMDHCWWSECTVKAVYELKICLIQRPTKKHIQIWVSITPMWTQNPPHHNWIVIEGRLSWRSVRTSQSVLILISTSLYQAQLVYSKLSRLSPFSTTYLAPRLYELANRKVSCNNYM